MTRHKAPLYFQHRGHSRTIVGVEMAGCADRISAGCADAPTHGQVTALVVFDPAVPRWKMEADLSATAWGACLRVESHRLREAEYQIVYVAMETTSQGGVAPATLPRDVVVSCDHASETVFLL